MTTVDIAIIINSYNRIHLLRESISALDSWIPTSQFATRVATIVYDAGSTDGSISWLQEQSSSHVFPLHLILPQPNDDTSFAAGLNTGVLMAEMLYPSLKFLLFYETDNQILAAKPMCQALELLNKTERLAACGFTVRRCDGTAAGSGMAFPNVLNFALGTRLVHKLQLEAIPYRWLDSGNGVLFSYVDVVFTSPLLVKINAWDETGGLDAKRFPFSDCDVDWAARLSTLKWKMAIIRTDAVIHDNQEAFSRWSASRILQFHRGRFRYFRRHRPLAIFSVWPAALLLRHFMELIIVLLLVRNPARRQHLLSQVISLIKSCPRQYEN